MSAVDPLESQVKDPSAPATAAGLIPRPVRRLRIFAGAILFLLLVGVGIFLTFRFGVWKSRQKIPDVTEIPTVNLEGADPAVAKIVREARGHLEQYPQIGFGWGQYAMVLQANGFPEAAHNCYDVAIRLDPKLSLWPYLKGELYHSGPGGHEAALPYFELAASLSPREPLPQLYVASSLLELGRLDEAEQAFRKVLAVKSGDPQAQLGLGRLAVARRQYRDSLQLLEPISENPLVRNQASTLLATVYDRLGDRDSAERTRQRVAKLPPDGPRPDDPVLRVYQLQVGIDAELDKAERLMGEKRFKEMLAVAEGAVHRYPESFEAWIAMTNACEMLGDYPGAERAARRCTRLAPKSADAWLSLGNLLIAQRRHKEALEHVQKSIELDPKKKLAYLSLGECRKSLGDFAGAAEAYKLAGIEKVIPQASTSPVKEPDVPLAAKKYGSVIIHYYANPQPDLAKQILVDIISPENLEDPWYKNHGIVVQMMAATLGDIGYGQEELVRYFESKFAGATDSGKRIIIKALETCGDKTTSQVVAGWLADAANAGVKVELTALGEHLASPDRKRKRDLPAKEPTDLDYLWGDFFATGDYAPISRILDVFDLPNTPASASLKQAAQFSILSNIPQHPKVVKLVKNNLDKRQAESKAVVMKLLEALEENEAEKQK